MNYDTNFDNRVFTVNRHLYNELSDTCVQQASRPQPYITVTANVVLEYYKSLGYKSSFPSKPRTVSVSAMADTGCQSSLAGIKVANRLGFTERNLIPVTMDACGKQQRHQDSWCCHLSFLRKGHGWRQN